MAASSDSIVCSSLTDDILLEIFSYLPLNSIYKLKSLSKVWLSNLSNPNFIIKWFKINYNSLPWILYYSIDDKGVIQHRLKFKMAYPELYSEFMSRNEHLFSLKFLANQNLLMLGSSNGLVLCLSGMRYHVCNPLTRKWVSLPSAPRRRLVFKGFGVACIYCEYSSSSFASCYKVIRIPPFKDPSKNFNVDVFSSDLGVWKSFQVSCDQDVVWGRSIHDKVVIHNGVLFWVEGGHRMLVYNLNQINKSDGHHRCSLINLPDEEFGDAEFSNSRSSIGESQGSVCYAITRFAPMNGMTVSVWVLNEVNWKILHEDILIDDIIEEASSRISDGATIKIFGFSLITGDVATIKIFGFSPITQNVILLGCKNWVWRFNIQTRSFEELCLDSRHVRDAGVMFQPFVLKPMPTILPPPSWIGT